MEDSKVENRSVTSVYALLLQRRDSMVFMEAKMEGGPAGSLQGHSVKGKSRDHLRRSKKVVGYAIFINWLEKKNTQNLCYLQSC